jgi:GntR family transcriptional regulator
MIFDDHSPIFLQISQLMKQRIMDDTWQELARIPSVRNLAGELEVNPNTCMRAYAQMQEDGLIFNKRGVGYSVAEHAKNNVQQQQKDQFINESIPKVLAQAKALGLSQKEWTDLWS